MATNNPFILVAAKIGEIAVEYVKNEYAAQGHTLTGALIDSIEAKVKESPTGAIIEGYLLEYGVPVNTGVPAANIPYNPSRRSGAKTSNYIAGLQLFAELRFRVSKKEALRIAFAIARKHKQQGMPTASSKRYSKTGKRTGAIQDGLQKADPDIEALITEVVTAYVEDIIIEVFVKNIPNVKVK